MNPEEEISKLRLPVFSYLHQMQMYDPTGILKVPTMVVVSRFHDYYINEIKSKAIYNSFSNTDPADLAGVLQLIEGQIAEHVQYFNVVLLEIEQLLISHLEKYGFGSDEEKDFIATVKEGDLLPTITDRNSYWNIIQEFYKNFQYGSPYINRQGTVLTIDKLLIDSDLGSLIHNKYEATADFRESTAVMSIKFLILQVIRLEQALDKVNIFDTLQQQTKGPGNPNFTKILSDQEFLDIVQFGREKLKEDPEQYTPRKGAIASEQLLLEIEVQFGVPSSTFRDYLVRHDITLRSAD